MIIFKHIYIVSQDINLTDTNNTPIRVDFCMKNSLAYGDYLKVYFYDKNSKQYFQVYSYGDIKDKWKCIGIAIPEYYKHSDFRVKFLLYTNGDGNEEYVLYSSYLNEDMYTKISKIIGNSIAVDYTIHGFLPAFDIISLFLY